MNLKELTKRKRVCDEIMTNKQKAQEIANKYNMRADVYNACLEAMEWKDEQYRNKQM